MIVYLKGMKNKTSNERQHNISSYLESNPDLFLECVEFVIKEKIKKH